MKKGIKKEDIDCQIENPEKLYDNDNFSKILIELFCKDLSIEEIEMLITILKN